MLAADRFFFLFRISVVRVLEILRAVKLDGLRDPGVNRDQPLHPLTFFFGRSLGLLGLQDHLQALRGARCGGWRDGRAVPASDPLAGWFTCWFTFDRSGSGKR